MIVSVVRVALAGVVLSSPARRLFVEHGLLWLYLVASAFVIAMVSVPLVRAYALWRGVLDQPSARKVHAVPTPLLGGAAVYAAFAITVLVNFNFSRELKGVALGAALVVVIGILDDVADLPAWL